MIREVVLTLGVIRFAVLCRMRALLLDDEL